MPSLIKSGNQYIFVGGYDERHVAKSAGFRWNPAAKRWWTDDPRRAAQLVGHVEMADQLREMLDTATATAKASVTPTA